MTIPGFKFGHESVCTYCGEPADGVDHAIPVSFQHLAKQRVRTKQGSGPWTFACCWCNSTLGDRWFETFDDRCRKIRDILDRRARPILWTDRQLQELGYSLRTLVIADRGRRRWLRMRADWYESREYWLNLENVQWELSTRTASTPALDFLRDYFRPTLGLLKAALYERA